MQELKRKRLKLLSDIEIEELYALPQFTDQGRIYYFTLNPMEEAILNKLIHTHSKVDFILQLGYFKSKFRIFKFEINDVSIDEKYIMSRYFPLDEPLTERPSRKIRTANNKHVLSLMNYQHNISIATKVLSERTQHLVRCLSKPIIIIRELLVYFKQKRLVFPEYSTIQDIIGKIMVEESKRLQSLVIKHIPSGIVGLLDKLLSAENISETIIAFKRHPKNFSFKQIQLEVNGTKIRISDTKHC